VQVFANHIAHISNSPPTGRPGWVPPAKPQARYASVNDNRLLAVAGGVVFFSLLAIFPAIAAFVSLYGLIADASTIDSHLSLAAGVFPAGAVDILHEQITRLTAKSDAKLGLGFITGLAIGLWSANAGMKAIIDALNVVYDEKEKRSFVKLNLLSLLFTLIAILSLMIALAAVVIAPMVFSAVGLSSLPSLAFAVLRWPFLLILATIALAAIYRYGPNRAGNGFRSEARPQPSGGCSPRSCSPGTSPISAPTTQPMGRLAPPSA
jgi:membrane protein